MKKEKKIRFESVLEEIMYPEIKRIAEIFNLKFTYQHSFYEEGICDWFTNKIYEGADEDDLEEWALNNDVSTTYEYEIYRVDFTLIGYDLKIAIELDSKEFHIEEIKDIAKDNFLKKRGFIVWRFMSNEIVGIKNRQQTIKKIIKNIENFDSVKKWKTSVNKKIMLKQWKTLYFPQVMKNE